MNYLLWDYMSPLVVTQAYLLLMFYVSLSNQRVSLNLVLFEVKQAKLYHLDIYSRIVGTRPWNHQTNSHIILIWVDTFRPFDLNSLQSLQFLFQFCLTLLQVITPHTWLFCFLILLDNLIENRTSLRVLDLYSRRLNRFVTLIIVRAWIALVHFNIIIQVITSSCFISFLNMI